MAALRFGASQVREAAGVLNFQHMFTPITTGAQAVSATGAVAGTADVSALTGEFCVLLLVTLITATAATIAIEDSAAGDFSDAVARHSWTIAGPSQTSQAHHMMSYDTATAGGPNTPPAWRFGSANNAWRLKVTSISGGSVTINGFIVN